MWKGNFVFPFDFKNFDHQLWKHEVMKLVKFSHDIAIFNASGLVTHALTLASKIVLASINHAELQDPPGHGTNVYQVLNGLLSGMRGTSNIGNGFNLTLYGMVRNILDIFN